ncbi:MAG: UDP-3-O-(3-hydroxymyristoyl)glucosamine N-acyltransferase [Rhodospirillales bacterium]
MADPRFYRVEGPFPVSRIAEACQAQVHDPDHAGRMIADVAPLDTATADHVSFLDNKKYVAAFRASRAGACLVHPQHAAQAPAGMALILSEKPYHAYALAARLFYPDIWQWSGVAATATVDPSAQIGAGTTIGDHAVIGPDVVIGPRSRIGPHAVIARGVTIGEESAIGAHVSLAYCIVGRRARIYAGARIGEDGFGYALDAVHLKIPQLGRVVIGDDVEIGANATIDRGAGPDTVIGDGCKIDNLVQIGHNVQLGRGCILVAQTGVSGSTRMGNYVIVGGQGGISGHLNIGDGARLGPQCGVAKDVPAGMTVSGSPAVPLPVYLRQYHVLRRLAEKKEQ